MNRVTNHQSPDSNSAEDEQRPTFRQRLAEYLGLPLEELLPPQSPPHYTPPPSRAQKGVRSAAEIRVILMRIKAVHEGRFDADHN